MKNKTRTFMPPAAFLTLTLLFPGALMAQGQSGFFGDILTVFAAPSAAEQQKIAAAVEMTDEQKAQMKEVSERYQSQVQALRGKYQTAYSGVVDLMQSGEPNKSNVNNKLKSFHSIHQQIVDQEVQFWVDFKSVLTPEQNKKFWDMFAQSRLK